MTHRSKRRSRLAATMLMLCVYAAAFAAGSSPDTNDTTVPRLLANHDVVSTIDMNGRAVTLTWVAAKRVIEVNVPRRAVVLRVPAGYDPALVGADRDIRFLPASLQPGLARGRLLFIATRRTTAGDGSGACGAGVERSLDVLDIAGAAPKIVASHRIGSCADDIELAGDGRANSDGLDAFSLDGGRLRIRFPSYRDLSSDDGIDGYLSDDLTRFELTHTSTMTGSAGTISPDSGTKTK